MNSHNLRRLAIAREARLRGAKRRVANCCRNWNRARSAHPRREATRRKLRRKANSGNPKFIKNFGFPEFQTRPQFFRLPEIDWATQSVAQSGISKIRKLSKFSNFWKSQNPETGQFLEKSNPVVSFVNSNADHAFFRNFGLWNFPKFSSWSFQNFKTYAVSGFSEKSVDFSKILEISKIQTGVTFGEIFLQIHHISWYPLMKCGGFRGWNMCKHMFQPPNGVPVWNWWFFSPLFEKVVKITVFTSLPRVIWE